MKYFKSLCVILLFNVVCSAQVFDVDTLRWSGDIDKKINLVILGDGYVEDELDKFTDDAKSFSKEMFSQTPFKEYENYFNTFTISVISNESGVSHPGNATDVTENVHPVSKVDNYFGSTFDAFNIHRLVVAEKESRINAVLARNFPLYDQALILANSPYYGGSGGFFSVATTEARANEIAIHEFGHSFANLADEYYAGDIYSDEKANMTKQSDSELVKWKNWVDDLGISVYQHCCDGQSASWYRPHQDCKMRYLGSPFCPVCTEHIIEVIHDLVSPVNNFSPGKELSSPTFPLQLQLDLTHPTSHNIYTKWSLNGNTIARNKDSVVIDFDDLAFGENEVSVFIEDKSDFLRVDDHHLNHFYMVDWSITKDVTSIDSDIFAEEGSIKICPNPVSNEFTITGKLNLFQIEIVNANGQVFKTVNNTGNTHTLDISSLLAGTYFVKIFSNNNNLLEVQQLIKK